MINAKLISKKATQISPWIVLAEKLVDFGEGREPEYYHSLQVQDYCTVMAFSIDMEVILVRQYRPAIEQESVEFPGGLVEKDEIPKETALRELFEETGFRAKDVFELPSVVTDPGRLSNYFHGFVAMGCYRDSKMWQKEAGVHVELLSLQKFVEKLKSGTLNSIHLSMLSSALIMGVVPLQLHDLLFKKTRQS